MSHPANKRGGGPGAAAEGEKISYRLLRVVSGWTPEYSKLPGGQSAGIYAARPLCTSGQYALT